MPLDDTNPAKRKHVRTRPLADAGPPATAKRSHKANSADPARPVAAPKPDANAAARADLDATLAELLPRAKTARDRLAVTYWAASRGTALNEAWRESAKKAAVVGNVIPDYTTNPLPVGTVATVYSSPLVTIGVKVTPQSPRLNVDACFAYLEVSGVNKALLKRARKRFTTDFPGAHVITAMLANT
jgi:hypothetical protein